MNHQHIRSSSARWTVVALVLAAGQVSAQPAPQPTDASTPPVRPGAPAVERPRATPAVDDGSQDGSNRVQPMTPPGQVPPTQLPPDARAAGRSALQPTPGVPAAGQPSGPRPRVVATDPVELGEDEIMLDAFAEGVELRTLVEYLAQELQLNIAGADTLTGSVVLNAPVIVYRDELLPLVDSLLEQQGFTIVRDAATGWYKVVKSDSVPFNPEGELPTTRLIATPGLRPSSLSETIDKQLGVANTATRISYLDELGVILITDSPRRIDTLARLVETVLERAGEQQFTRIEVTHIAATVARQRVLDILGQSSPNGSNPFAQPGAVQQPQGIPGIPGAAGSGAVTNLADRLIADAASNALIFRGFEDEAAKVARLLAIIDQPSALTSKRFFAGTSALQIAQLAERRGLGTVEIIDTAPATQNTNQPGQNQQRNQPQIQPQIPGLNAQTATHSGGPTLVVDQGKGFIIAYGTESQHTQLEELIKTFDTEQDLVVIREYPITNRSANDIADVLIGLIGGTGGADTSNQFLGGANNFQRQIQQAFGQQQNQQNRTGTRTGSTGNRNTGTTNATNQQGTGVGTRGSGRGLPSSGRAALLGASEVSVIADQGKNQIIVSAPLKQQEEFARLIAKLDQRRAQVYLEVQIVSVSAEDTLRVTVENQLINAGGTGGALQTNFGLSSPGGGANATQPFLFPRNVATNLSGLTAAVIKSDQVPIIVNALKRESQTRILSAPQLLVDDNETASIISVDQQPTSQTNLGTGNNNNVVTFQGYEEAGTQLSVTPSISQGGYLRLVYDITLSNFVGSGTNGLPPPRQERTVNSAVMLPSDSTMVVGGIVVDADSNTKARVPLLGEIPLLGWLFGDTGKTKTSTRLYIFITPRILRDNNFRDLLLLTRGPQAEAKIDGDVPALRPAMIDLLDPAAGPAKNLLPARQPAPQSASEPAAEPAPALPMPELQPLPPVLPRRPAANTPADPAPGVVKRPDAPAGPSPD